MIEIKVETDKTVWKWEITQQESWQEMSIEALAKVYPVIPPMVKVMMKEMEQMYDTVYVQLVL